MSRNSLIHHRLWLLMMLLVGASAPVPVLAQEFPAKPIRWIIPYPPGGTSDFLARLIGQKITDSWKQIVIIDNRSGANGNIGTEAAAKAPADGYTMLLVASTFAMNPAVYPNLPFDSEKDFAAVTIILWQPYLLSVHPSLPVKSVKELIALAKARPGAIDYGSGGVGNAVHIAAERFAKMAGVKLNHVPYRGVGFAIPALLAGEVQLMMASAVAVQPYVTSGKMRVLGVTGPRRVPGLPDVPTVSEAGLPGFEEGNWQAVLVPSRTPRPIVTRLNQELVRIVKTPDVSAQILRVGADVIGNTPDDATAIVRNDLKKYGEIIRALNIRPE
ncbi:MAG: tripartite tricarboxylate transporter substrate binding protein [Betaproteobacteria bacterium]|nr:tripartite tricarboxylate transporter substrate binding protein [Betaproteobacteria bacterium]